jgi:hypothetical protein
VVVLIRSVEASTDFTSRDLRYDDELPGNPFLRVIHIMPHLQYCTARVRNASAGVGIELNVAKMRGNGSAESEDSIDPAAIESLSAKYIIFSDLSFRTIEHLWSTQWMNPDFFESHLHRSGYAYFTSDEHPPSTWNTRHYKKSFGTIKWMRPVTIYNSRPIDVDETHQIIKEDITKVTWREKSSVKETETIHLTTNICRQELALTCDPNDQHRSASDTSRYPAGLEERITINCRMNNGCKISRYSFELLAKYFD